MGRYDGDSLIGGRTKAWIGIGVGTVLAAITGSCSISTVRVGQNETVVALANKTIYEDNVPQGLNFYWSTFGIKNKYEFVRIPHTMQVLTITAADKGSNCEKDCTNLTTGDQQTVTGSIAVPWSVQKALPEKGDRSVAARLFLTRGLTDVEDIQEKIVAPVVINCMIERVNHTVAKDLIEKDKETLKGIQDCASPSLEKFGIQIPNDSEILNRGFGPSTEARASMKAYADARQAGQVAEALIANSAKRQEAAIANMKIFSAAWKELAEQGVPESARTTLICLGDANSAVRPCVPGTATTGAVPAMPAGAR